MMVVGEFDSRAVVPVMCGKVSRSLDDEPDMGRVGMVMHSLQ